MKNKIYYCALFAIVFSFQTLYSQNWKWANAAGGNQKVESYAIAIDSFGNSYVTGWFEDSLIFGSTVLFANQSINTLCSDIFIAKYDKDGNFLWAQKAGGAGYDYANGIATDNQGNVYLVGLFMQVATFDTIQVTNTTNDYDVFVAKYNSDGDALWVRQGGGSGWDVGAAISIGRNNSCYITGAYRNTATFGTTSFTSAGNYDIFIASYDTDGNFMWAKSAGGTGDDRGQSISVDKTGNSYLTGYFKNSMTIANTTLTSFGDSDVFMAKYNSIGIPQWGKRFGGLLADEGLSIKAAKNGNLYLTGYYTDSATFDTAVVNGYGYTDAFIGRFDFKGDLIWVKKYGGAFYDKGYGVSLDTFNNVYVTGSFWGTANFDTISTASFNQDDAFVAGINNEAKTKWVLKGGGLNADFSRGIAASDYGYCYISGYFNGNATFGNNSISSIMTSNDFFVAKIDSTFIYDSIPLIDPVEPVDTIPTDTIPTDTIPNSIAILMSLQERFKIKVYPNPFQTSATIVIENATEVKQIQLFDVIGNDVSSSFGINELSNSNKNRLFEIKGDEAKAGIYFLKIKNETSEKITRLILMK